MKFYKIIVSVIFLLITTISYGGGNTDKHFELQGVSFNYPDDWRITEQEKLEDNGYYLAVEKKGWNASGIVTLTWVEKGDEEVYLKGIQKTLAKQPFFKKVEFSPAHKTTFNKKPAIVSDFTASVLGMKHRGSVYILTSGEKTYALIKQEVIEDIEKNKAGFKLIETPITISRNNSLAR